MTQPADGAEMWLDDQPLSARWLPPKPPRLRPSSGSRLLGVLTVALLVVGLLWMSGAFRPIPPTVKSYRPGEFFDVGPYRVALYDGTVTESRDSWQIKVRGVATNQTEKNVSTPSKDLVFMTEDGSLLTAGGGLGSASWQVTGRRGADELPPAIENVPIELEMKYPKSWHPTDRTFAGFWIQQYGAHYQSAGSDEMAWAPKRHTALGAWVPLRYAAKD